MNKTLESIAQAIFKRWFIDFEFPNENGEPYKSSGGEMVESELGMIPKGWEISNLGTYGTFKNGINYLRGESGDTEFFIANVRNIANNRLLLKSSLDKININMNKAKEYFLIDKDILIARSASPGEVSLVLGNLENVIYSGFSIRYRLNKPSGYLYIFLIMQKLKERLSNFSVGTSLQSINQETLKNMKFVLPSSDVLNRFNLIDAHILEQTYNNLLQNYGLSQIRDLLLPKLMTGKIRVPLEDDNDK
jgi:type I restriction enzyme S subunit